MVFIGQLLAYLELSYGRVAACWGKNKNNSKLSFADSKRELDFEVVGQFNWIYTLVCKNFSP